eukprot:3566914-Alexandrium_andersonii.AAC.1
MSASLVGSEMCIRDSGSARRCARPRARTPAEPTAARNGGRPSPTREAPVSYTHLTLPTICSV